MQAKTLAVKVDFTANFLFMPLKYWAVDAKELKSCTLKTSPNIKELLLMF